jgi:cysteinyl-tRNA synthetase
VHYRQKLNFTFESIGQAQAALERLDGLRFRLENVHERGAANSDLARGAATFRRDFQAALADDLNLSAALGALFVFVRQCNAFVEAGSLGAGDHAAVLAALDEADRVLGVLEPSAWKEASSTPREHVMRDDQIETLVAEREEARRKRNFARADAVRDQLSQAGVVLEDTPHGTRWKRP